MGTRLVPAAPGTALLFGAFVVLLSVSFGAAAPMAGAAPVVVGSVKCLDCFPNDVDAQDAFRGLQVAIKCKSSAGETYETQTLGRLDDTGAFSIPLADNLLRDDGELDRDCFAQLHSAPDTPCAGQVPPKIAPAGPNSRNGSATPNTYVAVADDAVFSPVACACGKFKKKHFMLRGPPPPPRPEPSYGPPSTPTPTPTPTPEPSYGPPTPKPPAPPAEEDPKPLFHKHPKMKKMFHKKKPCPPLVDEDKPQPNN